MPEPETLLATLAHLFANKGAAREVAILTFAQAELPQTGYDNWDGGTFEYSLILNIPLPLYLQVADVLEECRQSIAMEAGPLFERKTSLDKVYVNPLPCEDPQWRDRTRAWLTGEGVNNQGRVRSDNIAPRECDGLLFRSQAVP